MPRAGRQRSQDSRRAKERRLDGPTGQGNQTAPEHERSSGDTRVEEEEPETHFLDKSQIIQISLTPVLPLETPHVGNLVQPKTNIKIVIYNNK